MVPAIKSQVGELRVFQRTPNWFFPKMDPVYPGWLKKVFSWMPFLMTIQRLFFFYMVEGWALLWLTKVLASKNKLTFFQGLGVQLCPEVGGAEDEV